MINANRVINKAVEYEKTVGIKGMKKRLKYLEFNNNIKDMTNLFALISVAVERSISGDEALKSILENKFNLSNFKCFLNMQLSNIINKNNNLEDTDYIKEYIQNNIHPYYKSKFTIDKSRELSFLPLDLRLYVYNELLQSEESQITNCNYLDRINVTLAKIGEKDLASIVCGYNWVLGWGNTGFTNKDDIFRKQIHFTREAKEYRKSILQKSDLDGDSYIEEYINCLSQFSNLKITHDKVMARRLLTLAKIYYKDMPKIDKYIRDIEVYLETEDVDKIKYIQNERNNYEASYKVYDLKEKEIECGEVNVNEYNTKNLIEESDIKKLIKIADQGDMEAQFNLALWYYEGIRVKQSYKESVKWFEKVANQENIKAQFYLGWCYYEGKGIEQDYKEAVKWYEKSANQGYMDSQFNLAGCYYEGKGVQQDYKKAIKWYEKASEQGDAEAQFMLGVIYGNGTGVQLDSKKAADWYKKAAHQGHKKAQFNLGSYYYEGRGVKKSYKEAIKWIKKSANQGYASAQSNLGVLYVTGNGVTQSYELAIEWFEKAAKQGNVEAQCNLLKCYDEIRSFRKR